MFISSCRRGCVSRASFASAREDTRRYTRLGCWSLRLWGDEVFPSQEDLGMEDCIRDARYPKFLSTA
jgi:hypothetical protein